MVGQDLAASDGPMADDPETIRALTEKNPSETPASERLDLARLMLRGYGFKKSRPIYQKQAYWFIPTFEMRNPKLAEEDLYHTKGEAPNGADVCFMSYVWDEPGKPGHGAAKWESFTTDWSFDDAKAECLCSGTEHIEGGDTPCESLWWDKVSSPQTEDLLPVVSKWSFFFMEYIVLSKKMLVILSPNYPLRLWCVYEFAAFMASHDVDMLYVQCQRFVHKYKVPIEVFLTAIEEFAVSTAQCTREEDRATLDAMISENYKSHSSFEEFTKLSLLGTIMYDFVIIDVEIKTSVVWGSWEAEYDEIFKQSTEGIISTAAKLGYEDFSSSLREFLEFADAQITENEARKVREKEESNENSGWVRPAVAAFFKEKIVPLLREVQSVAIIPDGPLMQLHDAVQTPA